MYLISIFILRQKYVISLKCIFFLLNVQSKTIKIRVVKFTLKQGKKSGKFGKETGKLGNFDGKKITQEILNKQCVK